MDSLEDDKLDFGDLDDFDTQQDGAVNDFEDLAELERELGLNTFDGDSTTVDVDPPKQNVSVPSTDKTTTITNANNTSTSSPSRTKKPSGFRHNQPYHNQYNSIRTSSKQFAGTGKQPYHNYNYYNNNSQQQPPFPNMPYPLFNMMPMPGAFGQNFINMQIPNGVMGYNNNNDMSNGLPSNRRIHVNPKFAGRLPPTSSNDQQPLDQRKMDHQPPLDHQKVKQPVEQQGNQRKRQADHDEKRHISPPSHRRRLDTEPPRLHEPVTQTPSSSSLLQSRLGRGNNQPSIDKDATPLPSRPTSNGFSIRGAAALAAAAASASDTRLSTTNGTGQQEQQDRSSSERSFSIQGRSSNHQQIANDNTSITSRLGNKPSTLTTLGSNNNPILQRLGGKINKNDHVKTARSTTVTPIFANGKSSKLIVSNLSSAVTESTLKALEPKDIKVVSLDKRDKSAILIFAGIDPAVTFRRKYNRTVLSGEHMSVNFAKS
ncbi:hypothetical protein BC941DRAFT_420735 [Chlamydoabsidia padenii]|nr:hypothetical protein BC941DRAFT_420735 [Chlamydoabsidia padenii]